MRSVIEKPPIGGKELLPLSNVQLAGFRLHPGPLPEQYRYLNTTPVRKHKNKYKKHRHKDSSVPQSALQTDATVEPHEKKHKKQKRHEDDKSERKKRKKEKKRKKQRHSPEPPTATSNNAPGSSGISGNVTGQIPPLMPNFWKKKIKQQISTHQRNGKSQMKKKEREIKQQTQSGDDANDVPKNHQN